jgi:hypothetical protein
MSRIVTVILIYHRHTPMILTCLYIYIYLIVFAVMQLELEIQVFHCLFNTQQQTFHLKYNTIFFCLFKNVLISKRINSGFICMFASVIYHVN